VCVRECACVSLMCVCLCVSDLCVCGCVVVCGGSCICTLMCECVQVEAKYQDQKRSSEHSVDSM